MCKHTHIELAAGKESHCSYFPYVVGRTTAQQKPLLANLGITHVLNAADGPQHVDTGPHFYKDTNIQYHGVEASDSKDFDLSPFFTEAADFIHGALSQEGTRHTKQKRKE